MLETRPSPAPSQVLNQSTHGSSITNNFNGDFNMQPLYPDHEAMVRRILQDVERYVRSKLPS